ncbi:CCA tRNA nucleotidyltransferase [Pontibacter oryzae]|uniref:HD domain-containing protein n=1 Tax=Pontibacter oryzae TaxID=2304593 RepID=A0A399SI93_9BACT|nr:HD domain-containing protein [Pontibacter oryzae]RIJ42599.1 HD domain-containing protein [Pontibacter oryzae]
MDKVQLPEHPIFNVVAEAAAELGVDAYVIGGFVRDLVLKRPSKDIDVVCVGDGIALATQVAMKLPNRPKVSIFKNFGTAMLRAGEWEVEFVGARKESYREHSRKPEVEQGSLNDDLHRRDFTINALGISLNTQNYGELIDAFEGVKDMRRQLIRTPLEPGITFSDDPLRMMRAIRFASQLGFDIDPDTFDAIIDNKERIKIVSQERITDELNKIILSPVPSYGFKLLFVSGLLHLIFPKMVELQGVETINGNSHKDNFYHTLQVLDNVAEVSDDLWLRWAAIMHDIAKPDTKRYSPKVGWTFHGHEDRGARMVPKLFRDLKLPLNEHMKFVQKLVRLHLRPIALVKESVTDSAIRRLLFETGDDIDALMKLCRADITSKNDTKVKRYLHNFDKVEKRLVEVEESDKLRNFQPVITGEIIMETFGLKPSKTVGELKEILTEAILEGKVKNEFDEAYAFLLEKGKELGLHQIHSSNN